MVLNSMVPVFLLLLLETSLGFEDNTCVIQPNPRLQAVCPDSSPGQLLCTNTTYVYECRVQQDALRWRVLSVAQSSLIASETYNNDSVKNVPTPPENGFVFTLLNKDNGFLSSVTFNTTMNMQADTLECMEIASSDVTTIPIEIAVCPTAATTTTTTSSSEIFVPNITETTTGPSIETTTVTAAETLPPTLTCTPDPEEPCTCFDIPICIVILCLLLICMAAILLLVVKMIHLCMKYKKLRNKLIRVDLRPNAGEDPKGPEVETNKLTEVAYEVATEKGTHI